MLPWLEMAYAQRQAKFQQCPWVFQKDRERIKSFRKAWASACTRAGMPDLLFHDLRAPRFAIWSVLASRARWQWP
jgi:integrase